MDDGSTDGTTAVVESFEASYLHFIENEQNSGSGTIACNQGIQRAHGEYTVILDSDDEFLPTLIEQSSDILMANDDVDFVYSDYYDRFPDKSRKTVETDTDILNTVKSA